MVQTTERRCALDDESRPRKLKTLGNTINTLFTRKLEEAELTALIEQLKKLRYISVREGKVTYKLSGQDS